MSRISALAGRFRGGAPRSTRHKLHAVRFRRLIEGLCRIIELGDDASDKLGGDWILDRSYVASFVQRTLDRARQVVFDSAVLTGDASPELGAGLDAVRSDLARLTTAPPPSVGGGEAAGGGLEEPEYRLLRAAIGRLAPPSSATLATGGSATAPSLAEVLQEAHERALRSFDSLHFRSWGRRAGCVVLESGFPGSLRVVEAGGGMSRAPDREWRSRVRWSQVRSRPLRALLEPLTPLGQGQTLAPPSPTALAILAEERSTLTVGWPEGALVIDARLEEHATANFVYCALRGESPGSAGALAGALTESGFHLQELGPGLTGWMGGGDATATRTALGRMGGSLEELLRKRSGE